MDELLKVLIVIRFTASLVGLWLVGFGVLRVIWGKKLYKLARWFEMSLVLSFIVGPWWLYVCNRVLGGNLSSITSWLLLGFGSLILIVVDSFKTNSRPISYGKELAGLKEYFSIKNLKVNWDVMLISTVGLGMGYWAWFWKKTGLVGADSGYYLAQASEVVRSGQIPWSLDRSLVISLGGNLSLLSGLSPEIGWRLVMMGVVVMSALVIFLIVENLFGKKNGFLAGVMSLVSFAVFRTSLDIYAQAMATMGLYGIVYLVLRAMAENKARKEWLVMIAIVWGSLFSTHGLISIASVGVVGLPLVLIGREIFKVGVTWEFFLGLLLVFVSLGYPYVGVGWRFVYEETTRVWVNKVTVDEVVSEKENVESDEDVLVSNVGLEVNKKSFPYNMDSFGESYDLWWLVISILAMWMILYEWLMGKLDRGMKLVITFGLGLFLLTQQELFGVNWLPTRFINVLFGVIIVVNVYMVEKIFRYTRKTKVQQKLVVCGACLLLVGSGFGHVRELLIKGFRLALAEETYAFYKSIGERLPKGSPVYANTNHPNWSSGLNPNLNIVSVSKESVCERDIFKTPLKMNEFVLGSAFSKKTDQIESERILFLESGKNDYYVLYKKNTCGEDSHFLNEKYEVLDEFEDMVLVWRVLKEGEISIIRDNENEFKD